MHRLGNHERESSMNRLRVVSAAEWRAAREELLVKEKEATRTRDALAAEWRRLPMVKVEKDARAQGSARCTTLWTSMA
jgi:predicted dithiol-disulfide oxidoreductase (DUF899 family)